MRRPHWFRVFATIGFIVGLIAWLMPQPSRGATFTVTNTNDSGAGSLRQAIIDANNTAAIDTINFNIPGTGVHTLNLTNFLPFINTPVIIDGTSQPGWSAGNPVIEINGENTVNGSMGLRFLNIPSSAAASFVKGLVINNFPNQGILIENSSNITVTGCFIGTDPTGTVTRGNFDGIVIKSDASSNAINNVIGGNSLAERNILTGNTGFGLLITDSINETVHDNQIIGNYIGTDVTGMIRLGPQDGMAVSASNNFIGGTGSGEGNVISGSSTDGLTISGSLNNVQGNLIGVAADGISPLPNLRHGIRLFGSDFQNQSNNLIGGTIAAAKNIIAYNRKAGVSLENIDPNFGSTGNRILRNSIFANGGLGIDLKNDGVTVNDPGDGDTGHNGLQNFPVISSATFDGTTTTITGTINSNPATSLRLDFFANNTCDPTGNGEGEIFLTTTTVTTNAVGNASFNVTLLQPKTAYGQYITATATRTVAPLNTSEFSACHPVTLPTFTVTNANDSGAGSLRQAITDANANADLNLINFNIPGSGVRTITPSGSLPTITNPVVIDGLTQPGASCDTPLIQINGRNAGAGLDGLLISAGDSTVQGLIINQFDSEGISLTTNGGNVIKCNRIGTNAAGTGDAGNDGNGILVSSCDSNVIQNNTISGNTLSGIRFVSSSNNMIKGNIIGLSSNGQTPIGNGGGIAFFTSGSSNLVGGLTEADRNIISGNNGAGILLRDSGVTNNTIQGNYIGVNPTGSGSGFGNVSDGIQILLSASNNRIGSTIPGAGNTIAFNGNRGVVMTNTAGTGNQIRGNSIADNGTPTNFIGIDLNADGITANDAGDVDTGANNLQNFPVITSAETYAAGTLIRGTLNSQANTTYAIDLFANPSCDALGNGEGELYLGSLSVTTDAAGQVTFSQLVDTPLLIGQAVTATATRNTVPFDTSEFSQCRTVTAFDPTPLTVTNTNNTGSGSLRLAITTANSNPDLNVINFNISGSGVKTIILTSPLPAITESVIIEGLSQHGATCSVPLIELDGTSAGAGADGIQITGASNCLLSGLVINRFNGDGVELFNSDHNLVKCCFIGTDATGTSALPNSGYGININKGNTNTIGGAFSDGNVISGNLLSGLRIELSDSNTVLGNKIGLNVTGSAPLNNVVNGVHILNSSNILVGGTNGGARNIISGNSHSGILVEANAAFTVNNTVIQGNYIGLNAAGTAAGGVGNVEDGIRISGTDIYDTLIGGTTSGARNVISNNQLFGVRAGLPTNLYIQGNFIGTTASGLVDAGNVQDGVGVSGINLVIGGTTAAERNIISGNSTGVFIGGIATTGVVQGNYIGLGVDGSTVVNNLDGVVVTNDPPNVVIGGTTPGAGNVISGNGDTGISIFANGLTVQGNLIGTDATGTLDRGNGGFVGLSAGIFIDGSNNLIGGSTSAARNVISGNSIGINLVDSAPSNPVSNNLIRNNFIGTNAAGTGALGNSFSGINLQSASDNTIGGNVGEGNVIAFNDEGVTVSSDCTGNRIQANSIFSNGNAVGDLGIDLNANGVTPNDTLDGDSGGNNLQNYPTITAVTQLSASSYKIDGTLNSTASSTFTLDFYASLSCNTSGFGEGQNYLGSASTNTNGSGNATFSVTLNVTITPGSRITATATDASGNTSEFSACSQPTVIELIAFSATEFDNGTLMEWQTGYEVDNLGFNLYRESNGQRELLNKNLLAGSALRASANLASGNHYTFWMNDASGKVAFWLEDIDLNGRSTWHGPVYAQQVGDKPEHMENAKVLSELGSPDSVTDTLRPVETVAAGDNGINSKNENLKLTKKSQQVNPESRALIESQPAIKIAVSHEGFYRLSRTELLAAGLSKNANPQSIKMYVEGKEIPISVVTDVSGILQGVEFYAVGLNTPSTNIRIYWLVEGAGAGKRLVLNTGKGEIRPSSFVETVERRDRSIYFAALLNGEKENFFGSVITSQGVDQSLTLKTPAINDPTKATLEITLQGVTQQAHRVMVQLNGNLMGYLNFNAHQNLTEKFEIPASYLQAGTNLVRLASQNGAGDVSLIDTLRISYAKTFTAENNQLRFTAKEGERISIIGFTSKTVRVFDVTEIDNPHELAWTPEETKSGGLVVNLSPYEKGSRRLWAISSDQTSQPVSLILNDPSDLKVASGADLVVIAASRFMEALNAYKQKREAEGIKVSLVSVEDIYDEFNYGNKSPQAIKSFLASTQGTKLKHPRFVMLVGDASYDARNYLGRGEFDLLPTKLIDTEFMETASDDWFADFNNDGVAEMAVGRLPVRERADLDNLLAKILNYQPTMASALLVADANDGFDFEAANSSIGSMIESQMKVEELNRGQLNSTTAKAKLVEAFGRGQRLVNYIGHGSVNEWRGSLLTAQEARNLINVNLPFVVTMSCLNGDFSDAESESIGEALMNARRGGAIGVWASSGITSPHGQKVMNQEFIKRLVNPASREITIGEIVQLAKAMVADLDIRRTWILLGDPTIRLK